MTIDAKSTPPSFLPLPAHPAARTPVENSFTAGEFQFEVFSLRSAAVAAAAAGAAAAAAP